MSQITQFNVRGDTISLPKYPSFNSGSKGYYTAEFTFDEAWDGLIPHIVIIENGTKRADEVIVDGTHKIAVTESGTMQISVYGLDAEGNKCISCNYVVLSVQKGSYDKAPSLPSDIWEGYQITVLGYVERAELFATSAKKDAESASTMKGEAEIFRNEAHDFSDNAFFAFLNALKAANSIKNMTVEATSGTEADVTVTETEDGLHLNFVLPEGVQGLPGKNGAKGDTGDTGASGKDGYTPKKGVDYWTPNDIAEIKGYVDDAILGGAW